VEALFVGSPVASLREVRAERLLSIRELAQQAGVAPTTVYLIEVGRTTPRFGVIRRLTAALGVEAAAIAEFRQAIEAAQEPRPPRRPQGHD
jgi:DNA-binding XRE family transcriptional regulator